MMAFKVFDQSMKFGNFENVVLSDAPTCPQGHELVAFRIALQYVDQDEPFKWRLSIPLKEYYAVEFESQIRQVLGDSARTELRPVWGREIDCDYDEYEPPAPSYDTVAVRQAVEASKYLDFVSRNKPEEVLEALDVAVRYSSEVACTDYKFYERLCRAENVAPMPHKAPHHENRLHA